MPRLGTHDPRLFFPTIRVRDEARARARATGPQRFDAVTRPVGRKIFFFFYFFDRGLAAVVGGGGARGTLARRSRKKKMGL